MCVKPIKQVRDRRRTQRAHVHIPYPVAEYRAVNFLRNTGSFGSQILYPVSSRRSSEVGDAMSMRLPACLMFWDTDNDPGSERGADLARVRPRKVRDNTD